ncbi:MAG: antA/AntB antirepressor family protein [Candidatus Gracilibacteria bacterium]|nr:antA/AntB antirepressor family protein [Candidatus Gracilibacteria bacterium]
MKKRFVNARELYKWLGVGRDFNTWVKDRISKYDFTENLDYFIHEEMASNRIPKKGEPILSQKTNNWKIAKDYVISIDMAKELAMVENNEMGKKVRKYFIRVEEDFKKVMQIATSDPKFINQLAEGFMEMREETKEYRKDFTDSIRDFVETKNYGTYTDMLYDFLFLEKAKEYRNLLNLAREDFTRNSMYQEILLIIGAFETGLSGEVENTYKTLGRCLTKNEYMEVFRIFTSNKMWKVYQKRARNIMSTYDEELRNIKHPKLIDYRKEFTNEDIQKLLA